MEIRPDGTAVNTKLTLSLCQDVEFLKFQVKSNDCIIKILIEKYILHFITNIFTSTRIIYNYAEYKIIFQHKNIIDFIVLFRS